MQTLDDFLLQRASLKKTLTLVTGVFDVLHEEHFNFLKKAEKTADLLVVGLESDVRVKQMKGANRPLFSQEKRLKNLQKLKLADFVFILPERFSKSADHRALIAQIRPDFMAVSSNTLFQTEKAKILAEFGAKLVIVHDFNPAFSTSKIVNGLNKQPKGQ